MLFSLLRASSLAAFTLWGLTALFGCQSATEIRIQNVSTLDYTDVSVAGQSYGDVAAGATSEYKRVGLKFRYAVIKLTADGHHVTGQTLNVGAAKFTYQIDLVDLAADHLAIEVVGD